MEGECHSEGSGRVKLLYSRKRKLFLTLISHAISRDYLESLSEVGSFWDVGNKTSVGGKGWLLEREEASLAGEHPLPAQPSLSPLATAADTCLKTYTSSTPQFCLKGPSQVSPALSGFLPQGERDTCRIGRWKMSMNCPSKPEYVT